MARGFKCSGWGYGTAKEPAFPWTQKTVPSALTAVPELNGTAECRDLILLGPVVSARDSHPKIFSPQDAKAQFMMTRSKRLGSFIFHIPARSGRNTTLDSAVACVAAALREFCASEATPLHFVCSSKSLSLYGVALHNLHTALADPELSVKAETLCATELLGVFEVCTAFMVCQS